MITYNTKKMKTPKIIDNFLLSFKGSVGGFSYKRLAIFFGEATAIYISIHYTNPENLTYVLSSWLLFVAVGMGIVEVKDLAALRTGIVQERTIKEETIKKEEKETVITPHGTETLP